MSQLRRVRLPDFGRERRRPEMPVELYRRRIDHAIRRMSEAGLDVLAVYGDREHFANLSYLTGFDPRFEEALLLLSAGRRLLLVGNECLGYLPDASVGLETELFQDFSLPGQQRDRSRPLRTILEDFGISRGTRVGGVGWKCPSSLSALASAAAGGLDSTGAPRSGGSSAPTGSPRSGGSSPPGGSSAPTTSLLEIPAYLVDLLRDLTGAGGTVVNAGGMFFDAADGLRITAEPEQIAFSEYAGSITSTGVAGLLRQIRPGVLECDLERSLDSRGLPLSCHRMIGFGDKARRGLASPGDNPAVLGDPFTAAFGVTGALTCRAGWIAAVPGNLPPAVRDFGLALARNYFDVVAAWYGAVRIGSTGGEVFAAVDSVRDPGLFDFAVNPGHSLHLEEWTNSPFAAGSPVPLRSGMLLQMDIIPVSRGHFCCVNAEDGIALADSALRGELAGRFPSAWQRIQSRRAFMREAIGLELDDSILPLSNTPGWLPPFALDPETVLVR